MEGYSSCRNCKLPDDIKTANISYKIIQYPHFLFLLYDKKSYIELKNFIIVIIKKKFFYLNIILILFYFIFILFLLFSFEL